MPDCPLTGRFASATATIERLLGDPMDDSGPDPLSFRAAVERDESERFPSDAIDFLGEHGLSALHVPVSQGGRFTSFEELLALNRALSRRDPSVAVTAGMAMWSQLVWMAGSAAQRSRVRDVVLSNGGLCFAASEPDHGADLLASKVSAVPASGGYLLSGTKWPIGHANQSHLAMVLARTGDAGPRSLSWFMIDKASLPPGGKEMSSLPKSRTLGLRSAELSGLTFDEIPLPESARIGEAGQGLELTLKTFQITRPLAASLSLGIADSALRLATLFASSRRLYGGTAAALPAVRAGLAHAFADLLAADAILLSTLRGAHVAPAELGVTSAIAKVVVPMLGERVVQSATAILGARHYLREGFAAGVFQKLVRDHGAVPLFDGSTPVCLHALGGHMAALCRSQRSEDVGARQTRLAMRFNLQKEVPAFVPATLTLSARGEDDAVRALPALVARWEDGGTPPAISPTTAARLVQLLKRLSAVLSDLARFFREKTGAISGRSTALLEYSRRYALVHAGAVCAHLLDHAAGLDSFLQQGDWFVLVLARLLQPGLGAETSVDIPDAEDTVERVASECFARVEKPCLLSVAAVPLGKTANQRERE